MIVGQPCFLVSIFFLHFAYPLGKMFHAGFSRDVVIKAYPSVIRNINEVREDQISRCLYQKHLSMAPTHLLSSQSTDVPQRYDAFKTQHYTCYPMEKLDKTLIALLESPGYELGVDISTVCAILISSVSPIELFLD